MPLNFFTLLKHQSKFFWEILNSHLSTYSGMWVCGSVGLSVCNAFLKPGNISSIQVQITPNLKCHIPMFQGPVCPLPPTPHALTQLRVYPSIWLTSVFDYDFSLIAVLLCFTSPEIDVTPSLHTRDFFCQHAFSPWIMNNNWCCICFIFPIHTCSNDKMFVEIDISLMTLQTYYTNFPRIILSSRVENLYT